MPPTTRRTILLAGALAAPALSRSARAATVVNAVLESEAVILDPYFTTAAASVAAVGAIGAMRGRALEVRPLQDYHSAS